MIVEDKELAEIYKISSEQHLQHLETGLLHLEKHPDDRDSIENMLRSTHSLKGDSRVVGLEAMEALTHSLEDILSNIKHKNQVLTPQLSDRLYQTLDGMRQLVYAAVNGEPCAIDTEQILSQLMAEVTNSTEQEQSIELPLTVIEDEELAEIYKISSEGHLQNLETGLLRLEKHPDDGDSIENMLRSTHSLKGDSRVVGLEAMETLTHSLENILSDIKHKNLVLTPQLSDRLYQTLDGMRQLVYAAVNGELCAIDAKQVLNQLMVEVTNSTKQEEEAIASSFNTETPTPFLAVKNPEHAPIEPVSVFGETLPEATTSFAKPSTTDEPYRIDTIRVQTRELDVLMTQVGELIVSKIRMAHTATEIEKIASLWEEWKASKKQKQNSKNYEEHLDKIINQLKISSQENSSRLEFVAGELEEKISKLRLLPLSHVFQLFPRMVRDLAKQELKTVELVIEGGDIQVDKKILEEIKDPLMHIVRNAVDHGVETLAEREKLGKPSTATIWLRGYQTANNIIIEIADDGRGLNIFLEKF